MEVGEAPDPILRAYRHGPGDRLFHWIISGPQQQPAEVHRILIDTLFYRNWSAIFAALNIILLATLAFWETGNFWYITWVAVEIMVLGARLYLIHRSRTACAKRVEPPLRPLLALGILWSILTGIGCLCCLLTGSPVLATISGVDLGAAVAGLAARNAALPRLATLQILLCGIPYTIGCFLTPIPLFWILGLQMPFGLFAMIALAQRQYRDVASLIAIQKENEYMARHDVLTGFANRRFLNERLYLLCADTRERPLGAPLTVLCLDLDGFKTVNDRHGHPQGDRLLQLVADRLRVIVPECGFVGRLGGDEFAILLAPFAEQQAEMIAARIIESIAQPFVLDASIRVTIGVSVGSCTTTGNNLLPDTLMSRADERLYAAKQAGKGQFRAAA